MATHTVVVRNFADANRMSPVFRNAACRRMAAQAHFVIEGSMLHSGFVGIVASCAGESRITISPTAALF
jgi:hypothetical protein